MHVSEGWSRRALDIAECHRCGSTTGAAPPTPSPPGPERPCLSWWHASPAPALPTRWSTSAARQRDRAL